jgi:histone deacetylase 1/2
MDVKLAFLIDYLSDEVYVVKRPGFLEDKEPRHVLKLDKALYELRQAPRAWYAKRDTSPYPLGFVCSPLEQTVCQQGRGNEFLLAGVYVNGPIIISTNNGDIQ